MRPDDMAGCFIGVAAGVFALICVGFVSILVDLPVVAFACFLLAAGSAMGLVASALVFGDDEL